MTHAAGDVPTSNLSWIQESEVAQLKARIAALESAAPEPVTPTITEAEHAAAVNHIDERWDTTKREIEAIDAILRSAAKRLDQPLI